MGFFSMWAEMQEAKRTGHELHARIKHQEELATRNALLAQQQASLCGVGATGGFFTPPPKRHAPPEGLDNYRLSDLAGFLGRVHELLSFAALVTVAEIKGGAELQAIARRFNDGAEKAQAVQLDLIAIAQELRAEEERAAERARMADVFAAMDAQRNHPPQWPTPDQWTTEELDRYARGNAASEPLTPNRIVRDLPPDPHASAADDEDLRK